MQLAVSEHDLNIKHDYESINAITIDLNSLAKTGKRFSETMLSALEGLLDTHPEAATVYRNEVTAFYGEPQHHDSITIGTIENGSLLSAIKAHFIELGAIATDAHPIKESEAQAYFHLEHGFVWCEIKYGDWETESLDNNKITAFLEQFKDSDDYEDEYEDDDDEYEDDDEAIEQSEEELQQEEDDDKYNIDGRGYDTISDIKSEISDEFGLPEKALVILNKEGKPVRGNTKMLNVRKEWS